MDDARSLIKNDMFITDMARFASGVLSEKQIRQKYHLIDESTWVALGQDESLIEAIELEKVRRIRSGATKRELAQNHIVSAPQILNSIMTDERASPRHRVDAIKTLDGFADNGPQAAPAGDRFQITIVLSADEKIRIDKSIRPDPHDVDGEIVNTDTTPQGLLAVITAGKQKDDGGGEPI
jgi:hypothetical protein